VTRSYRETGLARNFSPPERTTHTGTFPRACVHSRRLFRSLSPCYADESFICGDREAVSLYQLFDDVEDNVSDDPQYIVPGEHRQ